MLFLPAPRRRAGREARVLDPAFVHCTDWQGLQKRGLSTSAVKTPEAPGRYVAAKACLRRQAATPNGVPFGRAVSGLAGSFVQE